jgi:hypothetical protein
VVPWNLTTSERLIWLNKKQKEFVPTLLVYVVRRVKYVRKREDKRQKDKEETICKVVFGNFSTEKLEDYVVNMGYAL